jgi:formylglycine-generating enzyme required for sulfatase activity
MPELPIVVLAFANEQEGLRYLRNLPEELRALQGILKEAERNGLCRLELLPNATLDQVFDVFTRNRDQVTILHYAGHADSGRLLLESSASVDSPAYAAGLATFLGQRSGLELVFLNGCSTRAQVARLLEAGVAAVIATARAIDDAKARAFAVAFYTELASGAPLRGAYEAARGRVLAAGGDAPQVYYQRRELGEPAPESATLDPTDDHGFPWEFRPGNELVERWSLPDAAGNPEFGLPTLPQRDLPERPFRNLSWFTAEHAEVFFGRGYQVRELYQQVTDASGPPILLLYGASGVGKSSILDAGLVPRLESGGASVRYRRRDLQEGLSGSLRNALHLTDEQTTLNDGWRAQEAQLGKPIFVFLDQIEEVFTRPNPEKPHELDELLAVLGDALGNRDTRPRGKLVLSFRKEWLAELDRRLAEAKLPRVRVFLKQLDRRGIIEAIRGPARPGRLQRQYRLTIEDGLPEVIADNLLADAGSALAPTLEVFLTKMWERARQANPDAPRFDRELYETLKSDGYLLKDVLDEGLKAIGRWNSSVADSGLALDVLVCHTTDLGTASQRSRDELNQRYAHQLGVLDGLLGRCKDTYLLIEAEPNPSSPPGSTRLAHDLLAPLVQQRFRLSVAAGQRARRLLENRVPDWAGGKVGPVLDRADLATVQEGAAGMRAWTSDEVRLVEASREADERLKAEEAEQLRRIREAEEGQRHAETLARQQAEEHLKDQEQANSRLRRRAYALGAIVVVALVVALAAILEWREAGRQRDQATTAETNRALTQADELLEADPQAVSNILSIVRTDMQAMEKLRSLASQRDLPEKKRVRAALALLETDRRQVDPLLGHALGKDSDPDELLLICGKLVPYASKFATDLWKTALDAKCDPELRLRHAAALALFARDDPRWEQAGVPIVPIILAANPLQLSSWTDAFSPVKGHLLKPLVAAYTGDDSTRRQVSAIILSHYTDESDDLTHDLLKTADERQFRLFLPRALVVPVPAAQAMNQELATPVPAGANYPTRESAAARQANALITLAHLGETASLWPALKHGPDPRLRTYLIQRLARFGVAPKILAERYSVESDPSVRAALLLALAESTDPGKPAEIPADFVDHIIRDYAGDPDPGFHSAAFWLLRKWSRLNDALAVDRSLKGKPPDGSRRWFVNREGQTFAVIKDPGVFMMGSPPEESALGRNKVEKPHHRRIPRSFAISTREVTVDEFKAFLADPAAKSIRYLDDDQRQYSPLREGPIVSVTWFEAAQYCRWLSDREGVKKDQQCFPEVAEIREKMELPKDYLSHTGYRLPTEAEWEYACRAGTETPWSFGSGPALLKDFARHLGNSSQDDMQQRAGKTRLFKPNALGLFDMHGNVSEWCFDRNPNYPDPGGPAVDDREQDGLVVSDSGVGDMRIYRGGSFADLLPSLRSAYRDGARPTNRFPALGFRVARTMPP